MTAPKKWQRPRRADTHYLKLDGPISREMAEWIESKLSPPDVTKMSLIRRLIREEMAREGVSDD